MLQTPQQIFQRQQQMLKKRQQIVRRIQQKMVRKSQLHHHLKRRQLHKKKMKEAVVKKQLQPHKKAQRKLPTMEIAVVHHLKKVRPILCAQLASEDIHKTVTCSINAHNHLKPLTTVL